MSKNRIRFKQRDFHIDELDNIDNINWSLEKYGCGPTSIANILANMGFNVDPVHIAKKILFDDKGNFDNTYLRDKGINYKGLIHCLEKLINEEKFNINYKIVKIDFDTPNNQRNEIVELIKQGYMAIIHVGPSENSPLTFSKNGHYLVISDIDKDEKFYIINSNEIGDEQIDKVFDYDVIIKNMYGRQDSFNFLFIKNNEL